MKFSLCRVVWRTPSFFALLSTGIRIDIYLVFTQNDEKYIKLHWKEEKKSSSLSFHSLSFVSHLQQEKWILFVFLSFMFFGWFVCVLSLFLVKFNVTPRKIQANRNSEKERRQIKNRFNMRLCNFTTRSLVHLQLSCDSDKLTTK